MGTRRVRANVTSISWIPEGTVTGIVRASFEHGFTHYDRPPPDRIADDRGQLDGWAREDRFRFANRLAVWMDVAGDRVVDAGYEADSGVVMGGSTLQVGPWSTRLAATSLPDVREQPVLIDAPGRTVLQPGAAADRVRFVQSAGGRAALPAPRRVTRDGVHLLAPLVWTTLTMTLTVAGTATAELTGASRFPRHWIYGPEGQLVERTGMADFDAWYHGTTTETTPWGGDDTAAITTAVESALERQLTQRLLRAGGPLRPRAVPAGEVLTRKGEPGGAVVLLLDGLVRIEVDGRVLGELGPGVLLGERAALEGGRRTATVTTVTPARLAVIDADRLDRDALRQLAGHHRREELA